ncbi:hypothetical protein NC651_015320 [Populus alba x Populus x berolinensis]|nr:hypothetical protein NC651_015320 [Populus alba x Populus x berolinensis]
MVLLPPIWNRRNYMGIRGYKRGRFQNNIEKSNAVKLSLSSIKSCFDLYKLVLRKDSSRIDWRNQSCRRFLKKQRFCRQQWL